LAGARSTGYRNVSSGAIMPDTTRPIGWQDNLIAKINVGRNCSGQVWKPGARSDSPDALHMNAFTDKHNVFSAHLTAPAWCEPTDAPQPVFYIIADGYAKPITFSPAGYRYASFCAEARPEEIILASLCRSLRDSAYATKLGILPQEKIRGLAQGKIVLQARTAPLANICIRVN